jgi:hypothetical protein
MSSLEFLNLKTRRNQVRILPRLHKGCDLGGLRLFEMASASMKHMDAADPGSNRPKFRARHLSMGMRAALFEAESM